MRNLEQRVQVKIKSIPKNNQRDKFFLYSSYVMYYKPGLKQYYYFRVCSNKYYFLLKKKKGCLFHIGCVCLVFAIYNPSLQLQKGLTFAFNYKGQALFELQSGQMLEFRNIVQDQTQIKVSPIQPTAKMLYPLPKKLHVLVLYHLVVYIKERGLICATVEQITNV